MYIRGCYIIHAHVEMKRFQPTADNEELEKLVGEFEERSKSEASSSDTTDADEVGDIEELLNPGCPVYFNHATDENAPPSLIVSNTRSNNIRHDNTAW